MSCDCGTEVVPGDATSDVQPELALCFMFVGLSVGSLVTYLISRYAHSVPYTVILFLLGILLIQGVLFFDLKVLDESVIQWSHIDPHLLLFVFLPALLFGEAMVLNIHNIHLTFFSAALMAGPGAIFGTIVVAALAFQLIPYGWSLPLCLTFGSIMCATDPVAVVAVLKSLGASPRMTMLVTLEALMNDGAALVLYNLFYASVLFENKGDVITELEIVLYFVEVLCVSPLIGIAFGLATCSGFALANERMKHDDITIQIALTICCAYLSFFVGEHVLEVSGVLACCSAGVVVAWLGPPLILQHESMHSVWSMCEWVGNTLIFLLAGVLFGQTLEQRTGQDFVVLICVYLFLHLVRAAMFVILFPAISRLGCGVTVNDCVFMTYGGLRGAVGIALALALQQETDSGLVDIDKVEAHRLFFIVGGVAALTLLINATSARTVLGMLGLFEESSEESRTMQHYSRKRIHKGITELILDLHDELPAYSPELVARFCNIVAVDDDIDGDVDASSAEYATDGTYQQSVPMSPQDHNGSVYTPNTAATATAAVAAAATDEEEGGGMIAMIRQNTANFFRQKGSRVETGTGSAADSLPTHSNSKSSPAHTSGHNHNEEVGAADTISAIRQNTANFLKKVSNGQIPSSLHGHMDHVHIVELDGATTINAARQNTTANLLKKMNLTSAAIGVGDSSAHLQVLTPTVKANRRPSGTKPAPTAALPPPPLTVGGALPVEPAFPPPTRTDNAADDAEIGEGGADGGSMICVKRRGTFNFLNENRHKSTTDIETNSSSVAAVPIRKTASANGATASAGASAPKPLKRHASMAIDAMLAASSEEAGGAHGGSTTTQMTRKKTGLDERLMVHVRIAFLNVLRSSYWKLIEEGKIPRASPVALNLLTSIDIALDHVHEEGIRDWAYLFPLLESPNTGSIYVATVVDGFTAGCEEALKRCGLMGTDRVAYFRTAWTERAMEWHDGHTINCLAAFISAHLRAQRLVKYYLGESAEVVTEEESLVVEESNTVVDLAKHMLMGIDNNTICYHVSKQVARIIVHTQEDIIHTLSKEGILTDKDAEVLLAETRVNQRMLKRNWLVTLFDRDGR